MVQALAGSLEGVVEVGTGSLESLVEATGDEDKSRSEVDRPIAVEVEDEAAVLPVRFDFESVRCFDRLPVDEARVPELFFKSETASEVTVPLDEPLALALSFCAFFVLSFLSLPVGVGFC